ncbi:magnesium transporter [Bacillus paralicheniformis]|uniref:magnesium transporter CorA family protein n=1 Tax=Bacillus paralicheniformis TaxID=1648923 RepID=UPI000BA605D1|nr:magnesium transporter CorA family protein [Bacillus paralicheniformis]PAE04235.1 magnesium transporter [Bacillus paralicheniformis]
MRVFQGEGWTWYQLGPHEKATAQGLIQPDHWPECRNWFQGVPSANINCIDINAAVQGKEAIYGSYIYDQEAEVQQNRTAFHFYLTKDYFFTMNLDISQFEEGNRRPIDQHLKRCKDAPEVFLILLGELMRMYLKELEHFEVHLGKVRWGFHHDNNKSIIELIHKRRHELLVIRSLILSMKKVAMGLKETFLSKSFDEIEQRRTFYEIDRGMSLIKEYANEINYLLHSEEVVTSHRGNEIFKALTIFTTIFTPMTAFGALWGMNFEVMPELSLKYGYLFSLILIAVSTVLVYWYLRKKGWTGDLLKDKKRYMKRKGSFK